jgi:small neutral amino acid transporter SnatA (MarC family)
VSAGLVALAVLATVNPARVPLGVPEARGRTALVAGASVAALAIAAALLAVADPLLDALDISPESLRIAAGLVLVVGGVRALAAPRPSADPGLTGRSAAVVPVLFPLLLTPELALVVLSAGADEHNGAALAGLTTALVLATASTLVRRTPVTDGPFAAAARLLGALLVLAGVAYVVDGIRDV